MSGAFPSNRASVPRNAGLRLEGQWNNPLRPKSGVGGRGARGGGEGIGGVIHLDRRGEEEAANVSWELREGLFRPCGSRDLRVPFPCLDLPYFPMQASGSAREHGVLFPQGVALEEQTRERQSVIFRPPPAEG